MGELGLEHVEAQLTRRVAVALRDDEPERRLRIDEASDQPRARDAIDVDALAGDPRPTAVRLGQIDPARRGPVTAPSGSAQARLEGAEEPAGGLAAGDAEEVDLDRLGQTAAAAARCSAWSSSPVVVRRRALARQGPWRRRVLRVPPPRSPRRARRGTAPRPARPRAPRRSAPRRPVASPPPSTISRDTHSKCSRGGVAARQDIDRVLDRDRAEPREAPTDLHAQVVRLRGDLMDQEQPAAVLRRGDRRFVAWFAHGRSAPPRCCGTTVGRSEVCRDVRSGAQFFIAAARDVVTGREIPR